MKRVFAIAVALCAAPTFADQPASQPSSQPTTATVYARGLAMSIYQSTRVPRSSMKYLPAQSPDAVFMLTSLKAQRADFKRLDTNIQAEIFGEYFVDQGGTYAFDVMGDDGVELDLDNAYVASDRWLNGVAHHVSSAVVNLTPGWHPLRLAFYQSDRGIGFDIRVKPPGASDFAEISSDALRVAQVSVDAARASIGKADPEAAEKPWRTVYKSKGFGGVTTDESDLLLEMLEGPTSVSKAARVEWQKLSAATNYAKLSDAQQAMAISGFLHGWLYYGTPRDQPPAAARAPYTLSEPQTVEHFKGWMDVDRHGVKYVMTIDNRTIDIFMPTAGVDETNSVPKAIAGMPYYLRQLVIVVHVEPYGTASELNGGDHDIWVRMPGPALLKELDTDFVHEAGHCLMSRTDCAAAWTTAIAGEILSVSQYGRHNAHEDFAEFMKLYVGANDEPEQLKSLRVLFPERMRVMERVVKQVGGPDQPTR